MMNFQTVYPRIENYLKQELIFLSHQSLLHNSIHQKSLMDRIAETEKLLKNLEDSPTISNIDIQELGNKIFKKDPTAEALVLKFLLKENADLSRASQATIKLYQPKNAL